MCVCVCVIEGSKYSNPNGNMFGNGTVSSSNV